MCEHHGHTGASGVEIDLPTRAEGINALSDGLATGDEALEIVGASEKRLVLIEPAGKLTDGIVARDEAVTPVQHDEAKKPVDHATMKAVHDEIISLLQSTSKEPGQFQTEARKAWQREILGELAGVLNIPTTESSFKEGKNALMANVKRRIVEILGLKLTSELLPSFMSTV